MSSRGEAGCSLIASLVTIAVLLAGAYLWSVAKCSEIEEVTGRATQYRIVSGCYVDVGGKWVPRDSWRGEQDR